MDETVFKARIISGLDEVSAEAWNKVANPPGLVFDPFFTTKGPGKGLGLGLSISYNIIKDFGGQLQAENHADGGAVFTIDLAAAENPMGVAAE